MALTENFLLENLRGRIGKQLVIRNYHGKVVLSKYPDMTRLKRSRKQVRMNDLMADAVGDARRIIADDELRMEAQARLNVTRNRVYTALISEYFRNHAAEGVKKKRSK